MLPSPCRYFPIERGLYEVAPGLRPLGHDFGNGTREALVFQFDNEFSRYHESKMSCRAERLSKYYQSSDYSPEVSRAVNSFIAKQLVKEHPDLFQLQKQDTDAWLFSAQLTGEQILLNSNFELLTAESSNDKYSTAFDALCCQVQEDIAVMRADDHGRNWLAAIHLCSPSHWAAEDKIGKDFFHIHTPVPGIEKLNRAASAFVDAMINKGPYVRFAWGFATDRRLNHHPEAPPDISAKEWKGRAFELKANASPFFMRVERQVLCGLPEQRASVFMIRTYFIDGEEIRAKPSERSQLRSALLSMSPQSQEYKGLAQDMDKVIAWLDSSERR